MDGIYVNIDGKGWVRPKSKKEIKEIVSTNPEGVKVEYTSLFNIAEVEDNVAELRVGAKINFVGPDPYTRRNFYGTITVSEDADGNKRIVVK